MGCVSAGNSACAEEMCVAGIRLAGARYIGYLFAMKQLDCCSYLVVLSGSIPVSSTQTCMLAHHPNDTITESAIVYVSHAHL